MNLESFKPMLSMLKPLGINIDEVVPNLINAINTHSENVGKKCFFIFDTTPENKLQLSIYAQTEGKGLDLLRSYQASTIEEIINIITALKNNHATPRIEPATNGATHTGTNGDTTDNSTGTADTDRNFHE